MGWRSTGAPERSVRLSNPSRPRFYTGQIQEELHFMVRHPTVSLALVLSIPLVGGEDGECSERPEYDQMGVPTKSLSIILSSRKIPKSTLLEGKNLLFSVPKKEQFKT